MHTLRQILLPALLERQDRLARSLFLRVRSSTATHYREVDAELLDERCKSLMAAFCDSVKISPASFGDYVAAIAKDRIEAGYQLNELQLLMNILEELLWQLCIETIADRNELIKALSVVSGTVGHAKDQLSKVFLSRAVACASKAPDVVRLFDGT
jgi:FAD/FMN-containing dehydrogenase